MICPNGGAFRENFPRSGERLAELCASYYHVQCTRQLLTYRATGSALGSGVISYARL
jgi:hypothetical protein